jgi:hypothetical protein
VRGVGPFSREYDGGVSGPRPDDDPGIYTMPAETFRVGRQVPAPTAEQPTERTPEPASASASAAPRRRRKGWDIALTIVLLVLLLAAAVVAASVGLALGVGSDACGSGGRVCRQDLLAVGVWTAFTTPLLILAVALFFSVVLLVVRRRAFWVPLAGFVLVAVLWSLGVFLVWAAT